MTIQTFDNIAIGDRASHALANWNSCLLDAFDYLNLHFNQNVVEGYYVNNVTGEVLANATYNATEQYIPIEEDSIYYLLHANTHTGEYDTAAYRVAYYDDGLVFISGANVLASSYVPMTPPDGAKFMRYSYAKSYENDGVVLLKDISEYPSIADVENHNVTHASAAEVNAIVDDRLPWNDSQLGIFDRSPNIIDPDLFVNGYYVNQVTGTLDQNSTYKATEEYIPIEPSTYYAVAAINGNSAATRYAFYDANKTFISGGYHPDQAQYVIESPSNAAYLRCSYFYTYEAYIAEGDTIPGSLDSYFVHIKEKYLPSEDERGFEFNLPSDIYALVGYETNIYFENLVENWEKYDWDVTCSKGMQLERGFRVTPTADDTGNYPISIKCGNSVKSATLHIAAANAGSGITRSVIVLGDSTTNSGIAVRKLSENFSTDPMGISLIGTRGTAPYLHEGRSGWTFAKYFNPPSSSDISLGVENPWYNPTTETFDASYYFSNTGNQKPDWFFINLGINDTFGYIDDASLRSQVASMKSLCDQMIASMNTASPTTKIGVCATIPPNNSQDAFGKNYFNGQTRNRYKKNNIIWVNELLSYYQGKESQGVYVIPIHLCLDTVYNMGLETIPVNSRNDETYQSPIANGGVHPATSGYWQIADVYTAFLKYQA